MEAAIMKTFSLQSFAQHLAVIGVMKAAEHHALEQAGRIIEVEAKRVIGSYEYGWAPLKADTIARKANGNTPLLETGEMRDSIQHKVSGSSVFIGSDNAKAEYQELGTRRIPPRSFLMGAAVHKADEVADTIGRVIVKHMEGEAVVQSAVFTTHNSSWQY